MAGWGARHYTLHSGEPTVTRVGSALFIILFLRCLTVRADCPDADKAYELGDYACAFKEYKTRADRGDVRAQVNVGWMYYYGKGVPQDKAQALVWYRKAAEQGDVTSMFNLAYGYDHGDGVGRDVHESRTWYARASEQKNALVRLDLERLTKTFFIPSTAQPRIAKIWAEQNRVHPAKAADEARIADAPAKIAAPAPVVKKDKDESTSSPALNSEVEKFQDPRLEGIRQAAEAGDKHAQVTLGWIYSSGQGIPVDKVKAASWYRLAAEKGDLKAQVALGWMYYDGQGCGRNLHESALWYGKAAARGNIKARQMLRKIRRLVH